MKKFALILVSLVLVAAIAYAAELALSDYSFDDLLTLRNQITAEIMSRPEWKEVTVPAGKWIIGEDIPAGKYAITTDSILCSATIKDGESFVDLKVISDTESIGKIELKEGWSIEFTSAVKFTPPTGLGF